MGGYMFIFLLLSNTGLSCTYNNIKQVFVGQLATSSGNSLYYIAVGCLTLVILLFT